MPGLTDGMTLGLSQQITSELQLNTLAIHGLNIPEEVVERHVNNKKNDITMATHALLKEWRKKYQDQKVAFLELCSALEETKMASYKQIMLRDSSNMNN